MLLIGLLFNLTDAGVNSDDIAVVISIIIFAAVIVMVIVFGKRALKKKKERPETENKNYSPARRQSTYAQPQSERVPVMEQTRFYDKDAFMQDNERDKERRLRQLDDFLKNGIIDKEEYKILRSRYERGI